ncbi:MAG TPA: quinohemoprotein amine dehydrogenase subunit alpha [Longimicrobiales bacterium]|nr:quinohemoprotein amine dehydrogenase subunit alpha [Longimicrobiales bacterium]
MPRPSPGFRVAVAVCLGTALSAASGAAQKAPDGFKVTDPTLISRCAGCHVVGADGLMGRISFLRKTPEGWQTSIRRMAALHDVQVTPEEARSIVRYLSNSQGIAPEELRPGLFEVERRLVDYDYPGDSQVELTCMSCHSMGRVITERRTREEWGLLLATHRALYPLVDFQAFRRPGPVEPSKDGSPTDERHPMDRAIDHLSAVFPLKTPEWSAWEATKRPPQLTGTWALSGYEPGKGSVYGTVTVQANPEDPDAFTTTAEYTYAESQRHEQRTGQALVYTGYQWRGRSAPDTDDEFREVMFVERDQREMHGRWFRGAYDEMGPDVTLRKLGADAVLTGAWPQAVRRGGSATVHVFGGRLPQSATADQIDFGSGVHVDGVEAKDDGSLALRVTVDAHAPVGTRDLFAFGTSLQGALTVHDGVDRITATPEHGMARVGGGNFPKGYQIFEAIGWDNGPDGKPDTPDDLKLGRVPATWSVEEYTATFGDDDLDWVGAMAADGTFTPALDGPNAERSGHRNNIGDVWAVATYQEDGGTPLRARAHLLVTVPLYMRFEPWREVPR